MFFVQVTNFSYLTYIWHPHSRWSHWNIIKVLGNRKLDSLGYHVTFVVWRLC